MATEDRWRGWLLPGAALAVAVAVLALAIIRSTNPEPGRSRPSPSSVAASATASDDHAVVVDDTTFTIRLDGSSLVVTRSRAGTTLELARGTTPVVVPSAQETPTASGSTLFLLACDTTTSKPERLLFGHLDGAQPIVYAGPAAFGQGAADGLFLFALRPGPVDDQDMITVKSAKGGGAVGFPGEAFSTIEASGTKQTSGCYLLG